LANLLAALVLPAGNAVMHPPEKQIEKRTVPHLVQVGGQTEEQSKVQPPDQHVEQPATYEG
jgi:hypothetical protein